MRKLSTPLPNFAEAMLLSLADLKRFDAIWDIGAALDDAMMDFGGLLDRDLAP